VTLSKRHVRVTNFEARSVALIASWTLAGAALAQNMPTTSSLRDGRAASVQVQKKLPHGVGEFRIPGATRGERD